MSVAINTLNPGRILVVDDEPENRDLFRAMLKMQGHQVLEAGTGEDAIDMVAHENLDLVLLDFRLPRMDGVEVCRRLRQDLHRGDLAIVVITGNPNQDTRTRAREAGVDDFFIRPINRQELIGRVATLLELRQLRDEQRRRVEMELDVVRQRLVKAERLATLGTLAGGVGHELNNIAILFDVALASLQQRTAAGMPAGPEDLAELARVREHLVLHGTALLQLGRPGPEYAERLDLRECIRTVVSMMQATGRTKHQEVIVEVPPNPTWIHANRTRMEQIFMNLIKNASEAADIGPGRPGQIRISAEEPRNGVVQIHVEDNGCGIPADKLDAIFAPYFTTKAEDRGSGLGLAVVKQIVASYGGRIDVTSEVGRGSRFSIELPARSVAPITRATQAPIKNRN